jgi:hypothetical protein
MTCLSFARELKKRGNKKIIVSVRQTPAWSGYKVSTKAAVDGRCLQLCPNSTDTKELRTGS